MLTRIKIALASLWLMFAGCAGLCPGGKFVTLPPADTDACIAAGLRAPMNIIASTKACAKVGGKVDALACTAAISATVADSAACAPRFQCAAVEAKAAVCAPCPVCSEAMK